MSIDYTAPAELFAAKGRGFGRRPMTYHRFPTVAEALRYAVEEMKPEMMFGAVLEVGEDRFEAADIRRLYESPAYPLGRAKTQ